MKYFLIALGFLMFFSCVSEQVEEITPSANFEVWDGPVMTFQKADGTDPNEASNQDRINEDVWITRGTSGGQIYNIAIEDASSKNVSPLGTLWAEGTLDELENLSFTSFRSAVGMPQNVVGKQLVMYLEEANAYLSVEFTSWSSGQSGGFAYTRSTEN
jgi:hypothetical protein